jgi:hypothetical protein
VLKLKKDANLRGFYDFPEDTVLRGVPVPVNISRSQRKMFTFADDRNLLIEATAENLIRLKKKLGDFKELSGLECNIEKSVMLQVGDTGNLPGEVIEAGFPLKNRIKVLGITLTTSCMEFTEVYNEIEEKVQNK